MRHLPRIHNRSPSASETISKHIHKKARCEQRAFGSKIEEDLVLNNLNEVLDLEDHATDGRRISLLNRTADFAKAQSLQGFTLVGRTADLWEQRAP